MSAALLRKSLELVDSSRPSGFTPPSKQLTIPEFGDQNWTGQGKGPHKNKKKGTKSAVDIDKSQKNKTGSSKRKADSTEPGQKLTPEEEEQERVEENVRRLLLLSARPTSEEIATNISNRNQKVSTTIKKLKKDEKSVFSQADFDNFSKDYFGE